MKRWAVTALVVVGCAGGVLWAASRPRTTYQTEPAVRGDVEATVTAIGTLQPRRYVDVGAQVSGQITRLLVAPGATVEKGALLVEIDPSVQRATVDAGRASLAGLRVQLAEQQAQHRLAQQQWDRQQQMALDGACRRDRCLAGCGGLRPGVAVRCAVVDLAGLDARRATACGGRVDWSTARADQFFLKVPL